MQMDMPKGEVGQLPNIAITPFTALDLEPDSNSLGAVLSDLLMVKLGNTPGLVLVDRTTLDKISNEASLTMKGLVDSDKALLIGKMAGADITITGFVFSDAGKKVVVIKAIQTGTGIIINVGRYLIDNDNLGVTVSTLAKFVQRTLKISPVDEKSRYIAVAGFESVGSTKVHRNRGDEIRAFLEKRYSRNPNVGVVVRSRMTPLLLEKGLQKLDLKETQELTSPFQRALKASVVIDGEYKVQPNGDFLYVRVEVIGDITKSIKFNASTQDDLLEKMGYVLDNLLQVHQYHVADSQLEKAKIIFEEGLKLSGLSLSTSPVIGMNTYHLGQDFVNGSYQENTPDDRKQQNIITAIDKFEKAIALYPNFYEAMLPLAFCLLSEEIREEGRANDLLEKIVFGSTDSYLKGSARYRLRDRRVSSQAFSKLVDDPEGLINDLIINGYIDKNGFVSIDFPNLKKAEQMKLARNYLGSRDEIFSILKIASFSSWKEMDQSMGKEEAAHYNRGMKRSNIAYENGFPPRLSTENIGGVNPDWLRLENIQEAVDAFESVLFINPKNYKAMLVLATCLNDSRIQEYKRAKEFFRQIVAGASDEELRFIAADSLGVVEETHFSRFYSSMLGSRDYLKKKYFMELRQLVQERNRDPEKVSLEQLLDAYEKSIVASCKQLMWLYWKHGDSVARYIRENVETFVEMTKASRLDKAVLKRRNRILADMWRDFPQLAPHYIISCDIPKPDDLDEQLELLALVEDKNHQPLSPEAFFQELGNRFKDYLENGRDLGVGLKMGNLIRKNNFRDVKNNIYLAYAYNRLGNFEESIWLLEELVEGRVELAGRNTIVTKEDFKGMEVDSAIVLAKLKQNNYLDQKSRITQRFKGLNITFKEDLANFDEHVMAQISSALDRGHGIRITPAKPGEKAYFLYKSDPLEKWLRILQNENKQNQQNDYYEPIVQFFKGEVVGDIVDDNGVIWLTTHHLPGEASPGNSDPRVYRSQGGRIPSRLELPFELKGMINGIAARDNTLWLGTDEGLLELFTDRKGFQFYTKSKGLPVAKVTSLALAENRLYLGLSQGFGFMDLEKKQFHSISNGIEVLEIAASPRGIWILAKDSGLYHYLFADNKIVLKSELPRMNSESSLAVSEDYAVVGLTGMSQGGDSRRVIDSGVFIYDDLRGKAEVMNLLVPSVLSTTFVGETLWVGGEDSLVAIDVAGQQIIKKVRIAGRNFGSLYPSWHGVWGGVDNELFFFPQVLTEKRKRAFRESFPESYPEYFRVESMGHPQGYSGNEHDGLYVKSGMYNGYPSYTNITGRGSLFYYTSSRGTYWALGPQIGSSISHILPGIPQGVRPDYPGIWTSSIQNIAYPFLKIMVGWPLDPVFVDDNDYQVSGFPDQEVNGIYKAAGNGSLGYPFFVSESGEYRLRFKRLRKTDNGEWELLKNTKGNYNRQYSSKAVRIKVRPDGSKLWSDSQNTPVSGTVQKLRTGSSPDSSGGQDDLDVEKKYHPNGRLSSEVNYRNGLKHGVERSYYENGVLSGEIHYENGLIHGVDRLYHKSGKLWRETLYKSGKKDGVCRSYSEDGQYTEVTYENDVQVTDHKRFYEDGRLFREKNEGLGESEEVVREYHKNGNLSFMSVFAAGTEDGIQIRYFENGKPETVYIYEKNKIVGRQGYDHDGKLAFKKGLEKYHAKYASLLNDGGKASENIGNAGHSDKGGDPQEQRVPR